MRDLTPRRTIKQSADELTCADRAMILVVVPLSLPQLLTKQVDPFRRYFSTVSPFSLSTCMRIKKKRETTFVQPGTLQEPHVPEVAVVK